MSRKEPVSKESTALHKLAEMRHGRLTKEMHDAYWDIDTIEETIRSAERKIKLRQQKHAVLVADFRARYLS